MAARDEPTIIGRYQVLERIGRGAMGTVYRATDPLIGRTVAIKLLLVDDADLRARFLQEVRAAGTLSHQNIVAAHDFGEADGRPFIVMEFVEGRSLADRLQDPVPLPWADKLRLVQQLCAALGYAHDRGVVHRDIKPANLMLDQRGDLKVVDFGIAKLGEAQLTRTGDVLGTLTYMSPEQINGDSVDRRSDIFSVGVVLYEILSSRRAFHRDTTSRLIHAILHEQPEPLTHQLAHLDPEWDRIIDAALKKNPAERYQTLAQLAADVARVGAKGEPVPMATAQGTTRTYRAVATRSRWTVPALVVASSLVVGAIAWFAATTLNKPVDGTATGQQVVAPVPAPPVPAAPAPPIAATTVPPTVPPKQVVAKETVKPAVEVSRPQERADNAIATNNPGSSKPPTAFEQADALRAGCTAGSFDACHKLAFEYARGVIVAKDDEKAFALDSKACEGGVAPACTSIGRAYQNGRGVTRNLALARAMYEKACDGGGLIGCIDGGGMLVRGLGGPADPKRAVTWFQRACDAGIPAGCGSLGIAYARGDGVDKDERRAFDLFQRACDAGGAPSCNSLADMYSTGRGVEKDLARAAALLERSCGGSYADACHALSQRYEQGLGVARDAARAADFERRATKLRAPSNDKPQ